MSTNTETANDAMIRKVRAMMDKATATDNQHERDTFMEHAARLAVKHNVTEAMLEAAKPVSTQVPEKVVIPVPSKYSKEHCALICGIARGVGAQGIMHSDTTRSRGYSSCTVVGFESERQAVQMLYMSLAPILAQEFNQPGSKSFKLNLANGFIREIENRLSRELAKVKDTARAAEKAAETPWNAPTMELVLADRKKKVDASFKEFYPRTTAVTTRTAVNIGGASRGATLGRNANLGLQGRLGS